MKATLSLALLLLSAALLPADPERKPNILLIASDDLNHWICYTGRNQQTKTPNIEGRAKRAANNANTPRS